MADYAGCSAPKFDWATASISSWTRFETHVRQMVKGPLHGKSEAVQCAYLLIWLGDTGRDVYSTWVLTEAETDKLAVYLKKFRDHIQPTVNPLMARYTFYKRCQNPGEGMEQFTTDLRLLAKPCEFKDGTEPDMIRDRILCGVSSAQVREKLLDKGAVLTLADAITITRNFETTQSHLAAMAGAATVTIKKEVDVISTRPKIPNSHQSQGKPPRRSRSCYRCGEPFSADHVAVCRAKDKKCNKCNNIGHFGKVCNSKSVHFVDEEEEEPSTPHLIIGSITIDSTESGPSDEYPIAKIHLRGHTHATVFKLDSGSAADVIPFSIFEQLRPKPKILPTSTTLSGYGGHHIKSLGTCLITATVANSSKALKFFIVAGQVTPILGWKSSRAFGLLEATEIDSINWYHPGTVLTSEGLPERLARFAPVFKGLGKMEGLVTIHTRPEVQPVVRPARRLAFSVEPRVTAELKRMEELGVIRRVTKPTRWVNGMVVTDKPDGSLRICLDPRDLNEAIIRPHYPIPTFDDIAAKVHGFKIFTKLDATSAYWMLQLDEESADLTTFNAPDGRWQYTVVAFGISCAQDILQQRLEQAFSGTECCIMADDIIVGGKNEEEHDRNLDAVLERAAQLNIKFNPKKLHYKQSSVPFFGNFITADGIQPDPLKLKALADMPYPTDHVELSSFLGMVNYMSRFIKSLSTLNHSLRDLGQQTDFVWLPMHADAVDKIKASIIKNLRHFDPSTTELEMTTDASQHGLGAHLSIKGEVVLFASKSLNKTERNYSQIEKELYAIVFGVRRFHRYIYGRQVTVYTDHKPLESVLTKPLFQAPPRLQRMLFALQPYRSNMVIRFKPGSEIPVADALSRLHPDDGDGRSELEDAIEMAVHSLVTSLPVSDHKMAEIKEETEKDVVLIELRRYIADGWPESRRQCPKILFPFWNHRDELSYCSGVILKGERIVIPEAMRERILQRLHCSHLGMEKTKERARQIIFWPGLNTAIQELIQICSICGAVANSVRKEPLTSSTPPTLPWQEVGADLCHLDGRDYLVTVDYYSRYFEVDYLPTITSAQVISKLRAHFGRYGIPQRLRSDNGKQFDCAEFRALSKSLDIQLVPSSPNYPQSNGQAEKAVDIAKRIMSKSAAAGSDPYLGLLEYRNTPVDGFKSPAQLLHGRNLRSIIPCTVRHLTPATVKPDDAIRVRKESQQKQAKFYNRGARVLPILRERQLVWAQLDRDQRDWRKAVVTSQHDPSSYWLRTTDGATYRRNRVNIRPRYEPSNPIVITPEVDPAPPDAEDPVIADNPPEEEGFHGFPDAQNVAHNPVATPSGRPSRDRRPPNRLIQSMP